MTLSVTIPESSPLESVSKTASTLLWAILLQASDTAVDSGIVKAFESLSFFTVLSPLLVLTAHTQKNLTNTEEKSYLYAYR